MSDRHDIANEFNATLEAHGLYNSIQFVMRLSPEIHRKLNAIPSGIVNSQDIAFDDVRAFSTLLHETIHWWQHVGSTYGLMASLSYPTQTHANHTRIKQLIDAGELKKPIARLVHLLPEPSSPDTLLGIANTVLNNHFDLGAFRHLAYDQESAKRIVGDPLFESVGHSIQIAYANNLLTMAGVVDRRFESLPDPRGWARSFRKLREERVEGFYPGSPIALWPIGIREIMEGQACFSQLQYLCFASGRRLTWDDCRQLGMLHSVYEKAFGEFLTRTGLKWPPTIDHPTVGLFLVICDMALNASAGFPFSPAPHFPTFISDTMPGIRFTSLSTLLRLQAPELLGAVVEYSRGEYQAITERLAGILLDRSPLAIADLCTSWAQGPMSGLMEEYESFAYGPSNTVARVLLSHFLSFVQDKHASPEFFCWPGRWMAGEQIHSDAELLFNKHYPLFIDKEDDDGVFPRVHANRASEAVQHMFDTFYAAHAVYDLTDQLITKPGPFTYDGYKWLIPSATQDDYRAFADRNFKSVYGVAPSSIPVL